MVPHSERKHAVELMDTFLSPLLKSVHYYFRVAPGLEPMSQLQQSVSQLPVVVYLAVQRHPEAPILVADGLMAALYIYDGQAAHAHSHVAVHIDTLVIRAAVDYSSQHGAQPTLLDGPLLGVACNSRYSAHISFIDLPLLTSNLRQDRSKVSYEQPQFPIALLCPRQIHALYDFITVFCSAKRDFDFRILEGC